MRRAAIVYKVSKTTLLRRRAGARSTRGTHPKSSNLTMAEEQTLVQYIRKLDQQGLAPTLRSVEDMVNQLRAARDADPVVPRWASNFVKREPGLKSRMTRQRDHQRILCSDQAVIGPWFDLVQNVKVKYGILNDDTYNFDETGFTMGVGNRVKVVTASERRTESIGVQHGDREWVTLIAAINPMGWAIEPYLIFEAKNHDASCYLDLKPQWCIGISDND